MAAKKPVLKQKTKKKKWFPLYAPEVFGGQLIGESHVESVEKLKGKFINSNLSTISGDMKKQNTAVKLRVNKVVDGKGHTEIIGMSLVQSFVKRLVRRGRTKVDDSFTVKTKDGQLVRIKPLVLTNSTCVASTASQIRSEIKTMLKEHVSSTGFINTVQDILSFKLQKKCKEALQKVHPIRSVDIRVFQRELIRGKVPDADLSILPDAPKKESVVEKVDDVEDVESVDVDEETIAQEADETSEEPAQEEASEEDSEDKKE